MKTKIIVLLLVILSSIFSTLNCQSVRPNRDSIGFCWNAGEMNSFLDYLSKHNKMEKSQSGKLIAAISVHDDYLYAGNVYYQLYKNVKTKEVVIFGVTHGTVRKEMGALSDVLIMDEYEKWLGPYGSVNISPLRELIKSELPKDDFIVSNKAHSIEHSIEALIPFLQYYNRDIKITPLMVTQMPFEKMENLSARLSKIICNYIRANKLEPGKDIFFLFSNDANHYGEDFNNSPYGMNRAAHEKATVNDKKIIHENLTGNIDEKRIKKLLSVIWPDSSGKKTIPLWCGRYSVTFGLLTVCNVLKDLNNELLIGKLYKYSDTFTEKVLPVKNTSMGLTAVFSYRHWCGWFTEGFSIGQ